MNHLVIEGLEQSSIQCGAEDTVLLATLRSGLGFPHECASGGCGLCKYELIEGSVSSLWPDAPGLSPRDRQKGNRHLACQSKPLTDIRIKVALKEAYAPTVAVRRREAHVVEMQLLTHDMMRLKLATAEKAEFLPGQFCLVAANELPRIARAYSMTNRENPEGIWEFYIKRFSFGQFTSWLFEDAKLGSRMVLDGPLGASIFRVDSGRKHLCIGGGAGLSYATAIARAVLEDDPSASVDLFYGARAMRDVVGLDELGLDPARTNFIPALSEPSDNTWDGPTGFVHDVVERTVQLPLQTYEVYLAGPPPMIDATVRMLLNRGVPREQIHFDAFY